MTPSPARTPEPRAGTLLLIATCVCVWRLLVAFLLLPLWESHAGAGRFPDEYPALASSLLSDGTLGYGPGAGPTTTRGPGFPLWLAPGMLIGGDGPRWLAFWSSLPAILASPVVALLAWRRFGRWPALVSVALMAAHPVPTFVATRVMSDELYAVCGFLGMALWIAALAAGRWGRAAAWTLGAAALFSLAILTRATGAIFLIAAAGWGLIPPSRRDGPPRRLALILILVVASVAAPIGWSIRSSRLEGRPVFVHSLAAYNFWIGEGFDRYGYGWTSPEIWPKVMALVAAEGGLDPARLETFHYTRLTPRETAALDGELGRAAIRHVAGHPAAFAGRWARGLYRFWIQGETARRTILNGILVVPLLLAAVAGLRRPRDPSGPADPMIVLSLAVILMHNGLGAALLPIARHGVQVYPPLAWLVASAASRLSLSRSSGSARA